MSPGHLVLGNLLVVALAGVAVGAFRRYAVAHDLLDIPGRRSSHTRATPRGGGIVIGGWWLASVAGLAWAGILEARTAAALAGGVAVALVGWRDDHGDVSTRIRLPIHLGAAAWTVAWLGGGFDLDFGAFVVPLGPAGPVLAALGLAWLTNLYNFMDGIDGLAASETVVAGGTIAVLAWAAGAEGLAAATSTLVAASLGFLFWNWTPARIFMGDVGSGLIGYALGATVLAAEVEAGLPIPLLLIPLAVFVCDATYTLLRRLARGERVHEAHRSHVYQRLVARGWGHDRVTLLVVALDLALAALAWWAMGAPARLPLAVGAAIAGTVAAGAIALGVARRARA